LANSKLLVPGHFNIVMQIHLPHYALGAGAYGLEALVSFENGELGVPHLDGVERRWSGRHLGAWPGIEERHAVDGATKSGSGAGAEQLAESRRACCCYCLQHTQPNANQP
jgi:hypothetical protein